MNYTKFNKNKLFISLISILLIAQMMISPLVNADPLLIEDAEQVVEVDEETLPVFEPEENISDLTLEAEIPSESTNSSELKTLQEKSNPNEIDALPSEEISQLEVSSLGSPIQQQETTDFITEPVEGGLKITDWLGEGTVVEIPDTIDGIPVTTIDKNAFQNFGLTEIIFGTNVKQIEEYAFADNKITKLTIPENSALEKIGAYSFLDNQLATFTFPAKLKVIEKAAFSNNILTSININEVVTTIGDLAFEKNKLTEVTLSNSITSFGTGVFSDNGRYVRVITNLDIIPKLEKVAGRYGHVVGAVSVVFKYIDSKTGKELRSSKILGEDMTDLNSVFVIGEEISYEPEEISGYAIKRPVVFTPDRELYEVEMNYVPIKTPPIIERILTPEVAMATPADELHDLLLSFVKATDLFGDDITSLVEIDQGDLDTSVSGTYAVKYSVTDQYGNSTEYILDVLVGNDWMNYPIGSGWVLGDFTYDRNIVTGLSAQGKTKLAALPAGRKHLVMPPFSPLGDRPAIEYIGQGAFSNLALDSVDFSPAKDVIEIRGLAFSDNQIKDVSFAELDKLELIGSAAFITNKLTQLDLSDLPALQYIETRAFEKNLLEDVTLDNLPSLVSIGSYAFNDNQLRSLELGYLPVLRFISWGSFKNHKLTSLDLSDLASVESIGPDAFMGIRGSTEALKSIDYTGMTSLKSINSGAFRYNHLTELDFSPLVALQEIGRHAFGDNRDLSRLEFGSIPLHQIGEHAFSYSKITEVDLSGLVDLEKIDNSVFARSKNLEQITFPVSTGDKTPKLKTIGNSAFLDTAISFLTLKDLPELTSIGDRTFGENANLLEVRLENLPSLSSFGSEAFYRGKIREIFIDNAPSLKDLPFDIVKDNPGRSDYENKVVFWVTPEETNEIPSRNNYLVNPDLTDQSDWIATDFTYTVSGDTATITGLSETGAGKLTQGILPVVIPERDVNGVLVTAIADQAFYQTGMTEVDFTLATGLKSIGVSAFESNRIKDLDLSALSQLETIGDRAFSSNTMETLNMRNLVNLKTIGKYAFSSNRVTELDTSDLYRVEVIGDGAFLNNRLEEIDLSSMESLQLIGSSAFQQGKDNPQTIRGITFGNHPHLTRIGSNAFAKERKDDSLRVPNADLSGIPKLEVIGQSAFGNAGIETLNLSGLHKLTRIEISAFAGNFLDGVDFTDLTSLKYLQASAFAGAGALGHIDLSPLTGLSLFENNVFYNSGVTSVNFGDLPNLTKIDRSAFRENDLTSLDLRSLTNLTGIETLAFANNKLSTLLLPMDGKLTTIGVSAFVGNRLSSVALPETVTRINIYAFRDNSPNNNEKMEIVVLRTPSGNNPNKIAPDMTANNGGHIVDPSIVVIRYFDKDTGEEIISSRTDYLADLKDNPTTYYAPEIGGYLPLQPTVTVNYVDGQMEYEVVFKYVRKTYDDLPTLGVNISHTNVGAQKKHVGTILTTKVTVDASSAVEDLENVDMVIHFDPTYIDMDKIRVPEIEGLMSVTIEEGVIKMHFDKIQGADYFNIPIEWAFKKDVTPQDQEVILYTEMRDAEGKTLVVPPLDEEGLPQDPKIAAFYDEPIIRKGAPDPTNSYDPRGYLGGLREAGMTAVTKVDGEDVIYISQPEDVRFHFSITQTTADSKLERQMVRVILKDQLPKYQAYNPETGKIEEWTAHFDPAKNPGWLYDSDTGMVTFSKELNGSTFVNPLPDLILQFPNGIMNQDIKNNVGATLVPQNKPEYEPEINIGDDVTIQLKKSKNPVLPPGYTYFSKIEGKEFFYDFPDDKHGTFKWSLRLSFNISEGGYYTNIVFTDRDLDERLYYESIQLQSKLHTATVKAFNLQDELIEEGTTVSGFYAFKSRDIHYLTIDLGDEKITQSPYAVTVATKLRDPDAIYFSETDFSENVFRNCAEMTARRYATEDEGIYGITWPKTCASMQIKPVGLEIIPVKTQTYPSPEDGGNSVVPGEQGTYTLAVQRTLDGRKLDDDTKRLPLQDFRMVDILPLGLILENPAVKLSPEFAASPGAGYEIVHDYREGRTAIIFTATELNHDVDQVAEIFTHTSMLMESPGPHTNRVYMSFDEDNSQYSYGSTTEGNDLGDGHAYMRDDVNFNMIKADYMQARKFIRNVEKVGDTYIPTSDWTDTGVVTQEAGYFQYMLVIDNNTDSIKYNNEIYDVLPHVNDSVMQYNNIKERSARNSEFSNTLISVVVDDEKADGYTIEYTADEINYGDQEAGAYLKTLNWTDNPAGATAFRVIADDETTVDGRAQLKIIVTMQAPLDGKAHHGQRAYNSFIRHDKSLPPYFLEANIVYNEIPYPTGAIKLVKRWELKESDYVPTPLRGAEFTLYDLSGKIVRTGKTDENGELVFDNIIIDDYVLEETVPPEGYAGTYTREIKKGDWKLIEGAYVLDLGIVENQAIFKGKMALDKVDSQGAPLAGVGFTLSRFGTPSFVMSGVTDSEGRLVFENLPKGTFTLRETSSIGLLVPASPSKSFTITKPDQEFFYTYENNQAIVNDKANVKIFKIGLLATLDPELSLALYSQGSGKTLTGPWKFTLKNSETGKETVFTITDTKGFELKNLSTNVVYHLVEVSGPDQTIYKINQNEYSFMVTPQGRLVDGNGKPFPGESIYFPNEKKPMLGEVRIEKDDGEGVGLPGAEFTLYRFNPETKAYDLDAGMTVTTDSDGKALIERIEPGSYELRETLVPEGYLSKGETLRFNVEKTPTENMLDNPAYEVNPEYIVHKWTYRATNYQIELDFVKRHPLAEMISLAEADELLSQNPDAVKVQRDDSPFYDVYIPVEGVTYDFFEVVDGTDVLIQDNLKTDTAGKLNLMGIDGFVPKVDGLYKLVETATKDNTWVLNTKPVIIDMREWLQKPGFTGLVSVYQNNYLKKGSVLLSKYDRYTQERLPGVTFTLYQGTLEEVKLPDGSYNDELKISDKVTDINGFASYKDLPLGKYVLLETKTLDDQGYYLFDDAFEFELTPDETHFFASVYNMRDKDYFDLPVTKIWYGDVPEYGEEPHEGLIVKLYKDGELFETAVLKAGTEWKHTFERLLKKDDHGRLYKYTLEEVVPEGYDHEMIGIIGAEGVITDPEGNELDPREITLNNYKLTDLTVNKVWDDLDNKFELRPESIELQLQQNGEDFLDSVTVKSDQDGNWTYTFTGLRTHNENNEPYEYTVVETKLSAYEDPTYTPEADGSITVTNKLVLTEVPVTKNWDDQGDKYGLRPESITLQLQQNGEDFLDPVAVTADAEGDWEYNFEKLPKFDAEGSEYKYTVIETKVSHYADPEYRENEDGSITVTNLLPMVDLPITKIWDDQNDKYGLRPESITLQLQQNGADFLDPVAVTADAEGDWEYNFEKLPKFDAEGSEYKYTVVETKLAHYADPEYEETEDGSITVINTLPTVDLPITKIWDDQDDKYGLRPDSITLQLQQNGADFLDPVIVRADADGNREYNFEKLPKFDAEGSEYKYTVVETKVAHYSDTEYTENEDGSITVINTLPTVDLPITKTWEDLDNKYGLRPESITLQLQQNGEDFLEPVAMTTDEDGNWKYTFIDLPMFDAEGEEYKYTVVETKVPHYAEPEYTVNADGSITITNPLVLINLPVTKIWEDNNNRHGLRPEAIILQLKQNGLDFGVPVTVKADAEGDWQYLFVDLPKEDESGQPYAYSVEERVVAQYKVSYRFLDGKIVITNQLEEVPEEERIIIPPPESPIAKTGENSLSQTVLRSILLALSTLMLLIRILKRKKQEE